MSNAHHIISKTPYIDTDDVKSKNCSVQLTERATTAAAAAAAAEAAAATLFRLWPLIAIYPVELNTKAIG